MGQHLPKCYSTNVTDCRCYLVRRASCSAAAGCSRLRVRSEQRQKTKAIMMVWHQCPCISVRVVKLVPAIISIDQLQASCVPGCHE
jgi:hypothetical protein